MFDGSSDNAATDSNVAVTSNNAPSGSASNTTTAVKRPPPESSESVWTRTGIIFSFWAVILCLGLPLWWKTTSIYRAQLPFQEMLDWDRGTVCQPNFPLEIRIAAPAVACADAKHFVQTTQHALDDLNDFAPHHLRLRLVNVEAGSAIESKDQCVTDEEIAHDVQPTLSVRLEQREGTTPELQLHQFSRNAELYFAPMQMPSPSSSTSQLSTFLANELHNLFKEEQGSIAHKFMVAGGSAASSSGSNTRSNGNPAAFVRSLPKEVQDKISTRDTRSFKYADTYHITFSLFSAGPSPSSWQIAEALDTHIKPWVEALSSISHFSINSQIQLYSQYSPSIRTVRDELMKGAQISQADLSAFINSAEWPLSPSIGSAGPTINCVLYVPSTSENPLTIAGTDGATEWLIPQWGGVAIYNPIITDSGALQIPEPLTSAQMASAFSTFRNQLLALVGLPGDEKIPLPLRIDSLSRLQTTSLFLSASATLGSLARLTQSLPSIPIPESVAGNVDLAMVHLKDSCQALEAGRFHDALQEARAAEREAEQAFFEKSMVGQVYFPDEHKVAVYLPLLGPVSFPLILGLIKEIKRLAKARKAKSS